MPQLATTLRFLWVFSLCCCAAAQREVNHAEAIPLTVEDAVSTRSFGELMPIGFSPDGNLLAYTVKDNRRAFESRGLEGWARAGLAPWASATDIWISNVATGETRRLTDGKNDNWLPTWSPDGHYLAFLSNRGGNGGAKLWVWDVVHDALKKVSDIEIRSDQIEWTADSRSIVLTALPEGMTADEYALRVLAGKLDPTSRTDLTPGSTAIVYWQHGMPPDAGRLVKSDPFNLDRCLRDLVVVEVVNGSTRVVVHGHRIATYHLDPLDPAAVRVVYTDATQFDGAASQQILFDMRESDLLTLRDHLLATDLRLAIDGDFTLSPDGRMASYCTSGADNQGSGDCYVVGDGAKPTNVIHPKASSGSVRGQLPLWDTHGKHFYLILNGSLWEASPENGAAREIATIPGHQVVAIISTRGRLLWSGDGGLSAIVVTRDVLGEQDGFYRIKLGSGESQKLQEDERCYTCGNVKESQLVAVSNDGTRIAYFAEDSRHDSDIWVSDPNFQAPWRLTRLNPQFEKYLLGTVRMIDWLSDDGEKLQGALLLPPAYQPGTRYPLIVFVYGGDMLSAHLNRFGLGYSGPLNMQMLATRGYAILFPDAPERVGTPMLDLAKAVLPGVNKVVEMGIADPKRLGVMGHSRGGYSTLALITQTVRFRAAISIDGLGDLISAYGQMSKDGTAFQTSITEGGQGKIGGTPWQFRERYIENSPIFHFERVETPVLIVHGGNDETVSPFLADEVFVALRRLGKEVEYAKYGGEEHSPVYWSFENQTDCSERMIRWFDAWLK
jgi:dipeptidyl aminopeptidase/acylaminoacyl peptidase